MKVIKEDNFLPFSSPFSVVLVLFLSWFSSVRPSARQYRLQNLNQNHYRPEIMRYDWTLNDRLNTKWKTFQEDKVSNVCFGSSHEKMGLHTYIVIQRIVYVKVCRRDLINSRTFWTTGRFWKWKIWIYMRAHKLTY